MSTTTWVCVRPLDTVMVRDGRPFAAGAASTARGVPPPPHTLGGAVAAALGRETDRLLGPFVAHDGDIAFPTPADVVDDGGVVRRLAPVPRDDAAHSDLDDGYRLTHHLRGDGEPSGTWLTSAGLRRWLDAVDDLAPGAELDRAAGHDRPPWEPELRLGLARHRDGSAAGTAVAGFLYSMTQLRPHDGTAFVVGCIAERPLDVVRDVVPLGGRGRHATVEPWTGPDPRPVAADRFDGGRVAVYLATPALPAVTFWRRAGVTLNAVACPGPQPVVSARPGGDFARSRLLAWTAPAGTVLYLTFHDDAALAAFVRDHHGDLLPGSALRIRTAGFGTCLMGRW